MFRVENTIKEKGLEPTTDYDRLFHNLIELQIVPVAKIDDVIESLTDLIESHRGWGAAYAVRAIALNERGKELKQFDDIQSAIEDINTARSYLNDSSLILTIAFHIVIDGLDMARANGSVEQEEIWAAMGQEMREILADRPPCFMANHQVTIFCHSMGIQPTSRELVDEADLISRSKGGWIIHLSVALRSKDAGEASALEKELRAIPDDLEAQVCLGILLAEGSDRDRQEAISVFDRIQESDVMPGLKVLAVEIALIAGRADKARDACEELLEADELRDSWRLLVYMAKYHAGRLSDQELESIAGPFRDLQSDLFPELALKAHADGKKARAKEYWGKAVDTGFIATWGYHSSLIYQSRLNDQNDWPNWISQIHD